MDSDFSLCFNNFILLILLFCILTLLECGVKTASRITGGNETYVVEYPWMALIIRNGYLGGGGAVINSKFVVSAATCILGYVFVSYDYTALFKGNQSCYS